MKGYWWIFHFRAAFFRRHPDLRSRFVSLGVGNFDLTITIGPGARFQKTPRPTATTRWVTK